MSKMNQKASVAQKAPQRMTTFQKAERTLVTCLLGESNFYEDGQSVKDRLASYVPELSEDACRKLLKEAKVDNKLRHAPIFWATKMLKEGYLKADDVEMITDRVDLMADLLAEYWRENPREDSEIDERRQTHKRVNKMVPKQVVKGLQSSLKKFDEYQLAKYLGNKNEVKLRDVLRVIRPKPETDEQSALWGKVLKDELKTPDTWEVAISACGKDTAKKKEEWTRLLTEKTEKGFTKLGALALLRNLRNMDECGVNHNVIKEALKNASMKKILPFQIIGAANHAPSDLKGVLQEKLLESITGYYDKLEGDTLFLLDVSGSMGATLSNKSELTRLSAGAGVAAILNGICESSVLYAFNTRLIPLSSAYTGLAMVNEIQRIAGGGTYVVDCTNDAIKAYQKTHGGDFPSRVVVITDEQDNGYSWNSYYNTNVPLMNLPKSCKGYVVNVGTYENGVNYNDKSWTRISGWSEGIVKYISEYEKLGTR